MVGLYTHAQKTQQRWMCLEARFVGSGATPDIMVDAHPHIGTSKLPQIIQDIREKIIRMWRSRVLFETRVKNNRHA